MLSLSGPPGPWLRRDYKNSPGNPDPLIRSSTGEPGLSLWRPLRAGAIPHQREVSAINAPTLHFGPIPARFFAPRTAPVLRAKNPSPRPQPADGVVISEPFWDDRRGPKTHSRRTGRKLGQVRYARQGLVRVPESNTKYGGKRGITGGTPAPVIDPSISESSEIPKDKKLFGGTEFRAAPAVHRASIYSPLSRLPGLHFGDSRKATENSGLACRRQRGRGPR
jgi:hypothetical protein